MGLLKEYGIPVPKGAVASTPEEAERIFVVAHEEQGKFLV